MSGKIIEEFINSCRALRQPHLRLEKKNTINPIITLISAEKEIGRFLFCSSVVWRLMSK